MVPQRAKQADRLPIILAPGWAYSGPLHVEPIPSPAQSQTLGWAIVLSPADRPGQARVAHSVGLPEARPASPPKHVMFFLIHLKG